MLQFSEAVRQVNVNGKAAVDGLMTFTPSNWAENYAGTWINSSVLFIQALQVDGWNISAFQQSVALPNLIVSILSSGSLTSEDGSSQPMSATMPGLCSAMPVMHEQTLLRRFAVASGSWGDVPCGMSAVVYSSTALEVSFSSPVTASGWSPTSVRFPCSALILLSLIPRFSSCSIFWN